MGCSRIGDYEVLGKLGEGTFGEVHRAKAKKTGAVVALKKIIMHNEKDGVSRVQPRRGENRRLRRTGHDAKAMRPTDRRRISRLVSNHRFARNQTPQTAVAPERAFIGRHGRGASNKEQ